MKKEEMKNVEGEKKGKKGKNNEKKKYFRVNLVTSRRCATVSSTAFKRRIRRIR
jgi:hypothetical protein